jgi:hypothetical protein
VSDENPGPILTGTGLPDGLRHQHQIGRHMPEPNTVSLANSYLGLAADQLLAVDHESPAALFAAIECLEIQSQLSELVPEGTPVVAVLAPAQALALAGDLLSLDSRAEVVVLADQLRRLSRAVS